MPRLVTLAPAVLAGLALMLSIVHSQEDMEVVDNTVFGEPRRTAAIFFHDAHNEKAGVDDCAQCHHSYDEQGKRLEGESSEDQSCSECHALSDQDGKPGLRKAFHRNCGGCHLSQRKGPVACGECHPK